MVTILLELSPGSELVIEGINYIFKHLEGVLGERIEPIISGSLETRRERSTEKVVVSINRYLFLQLAEMQESVGGSRVMVEGGHQKLPRKMERGDFLR